jgi:hypothetical protein
MNSIKSMLLFGGIFLTAISAFSQTAVPPGTVIPVRLNSTLSARAKAGSKITATVMQNVPLPNGGWIRAGAKVIGRVTTVNHPDNRAAEGLSIRFEELVASKHTVQITTNLRALAGFMEVEEAQIPVSGPDRGTPETAWTTEQIGGDVVYRGGGPVKQGHRTVGEPVADGVLTRLESNGGRCRAELYGNDGPQALWVFSADACGTYGLSNVSIFHAGRSNPVGEITLAAMRGKLSVRAGDGMLLRVVPRPNGGQSDSAIPRLPASSPDSLPNSYRKDTR